MDTFLPIWITVTIACTLRSGAATSVDRPGQGDLAGVTRVRQRQSVGCIHTLCFGKYW